MATRPPGTSRLVAAARPATNRRLNAVARMGRYGPAERRSSIRPPTNAQPRARGSPRIDAMAITATRTRSGLRPLMLTYGVTLSSRRARTMAPPAARGRLIQILPSGLLRDRPSGRPGARPLPRAGPLAGLPEYSPRVARAPPSGSGGPRRTLRTAASRLVPPAGRTKRVGGALDVPRETYRRSVHSGSSRTRSAGPVRSLASPGRAAAKRASSATSPHRDGQFAPDSNP